MTPESQAVNFKLFTQKMLEISVRGEPLGNMLETNRTHAVSGRFSLDHRASSFSILIGRALLIGG